jgi:hypothetical protein
MPDGAGEGFRDLIEVLGDRGVEMNLVAGVLDRRSETEENIVPKLFTGALEEIIGRLEDIVSRIFRVKMHERKNLQIVANALTGV